MREKNGSPPTSLPPPQNEEAEFNLLCKLRLRPGPLSSASVMTSDDRLLLILRRLDEIERKLDRILEDLRTPTAIGYSVRRGSLPRKD